MKMRTMPVYDIDDFVFTGNESDFYSSKMSIHLKQHEHAVLVPHGHSFYASIYCTKGTGTHEIDFNVYDVKPGAVFLLFPGQVHNWKLSEDIEGYVFFHTREFYDLNFTYEKVENLPFFNSIHNGPFIQLPMIEQKKIESIYDQIVNEYEGNELKKFQKICSQLNILYIELSRLYLTADATNKQNQTQLAQVRKFEMLIATNYKSVKFPKDYAGMMFISEKHLNRISKATLNKTSSELISDRIILEAKRMLMYGTESVSQIADELGYNENAYFFRMFKKKAGQTPLEFLKKFRKG